MTDEDRARIKAEARATLERLANFTPHQASHEDSLERWARLKPQPEEPTRERGSDISPTVLVDQRIAAWLEAERQKQADVLADMQAELGEALEGIAVHWVRSTPGCARWKPGAPTRPQRAQRDRSPCRAPTDKHEFNEGG